MGNLGFTEIMLIMVVVLLLFGAKRLPEVGASIGKGIREFKRSLSDTQDAIMGSDERSGNLPPRQVDAPAQPPSPRRRASRSGCRSRAMRWSSARRPERREGGMPRGMPPSLRSMRE